MNWDELSTCAERNRPEMTCDSSRDSPQVLIKIGDSGLCQSTATAWWRTDPIREAVSFLVVLQEYREARPLTVTKDHPESAEPEQLDSLHVPPTALALCAGASAVR